MIGDLISTLSDAQKLSIAQIQKAVQDGTLPAYVGIPLLQDKVKQRNEAAALLMGQKPKQPKVAEQVMAAADQITGMPMVGGVAAPQAAGEGGEEQPPQEGSEGIDSLQSNLPEGYAGGGIIAFNGEDGSEVQLPEGGMYPEEEEEEEQGITPLLGSRGRGAVGPTVIKPSQAPVQTPQATQPPVAQAPMGGGRGMSTGISLADTLSAMLPKTEGGARGRGAVAPKPVTPPADTKPPQEAAPKTEVAKPPAGTKQAARTQQAIRQLVTPATPATPESTISAAPPKEDTSIADEIARSRSERDDMMKMILGDQAADKKEAEENKWLSLAKAGFNIAGGRSPYAMVNIGEGMSGGIGDIMAAKEMARKQQQGKLQAAADYGVKSQQLENAMREMFTTQQHYKSMEPYYAAQTQKALSDAEYNRVLTGLAPRKLELQAARGAGGGAGPKASLDLNEYKYFTTERPTQLMRDPSARANLPGLNDPPGSPNRVRAEAALQSWARKKAIAEQNEYLKRNAKQSVSNLMTPTQ